MEEKNKPKNSKARIEANKRYADKAYDKVTVMLPKGQKEIIVQYAKKHGESINAYVFRAISAQIADESNE